MATLAGPGASSLRMTEGMTLTEGGHAGTSDLKPGRWQGTSRITEERATAWVSKGRRLAAPLLELAGPVADPAAVVHRVVATGRDRLYGDFMVAWLDASADPRVVCCLPDASFFLQVLHRCYAPVLRRRPDLASLLAGTSRPEMSLTNDVLQIQLRGLGDDYSMVRHHALMLFYAAIWLDEPERSLWLELYDELAGLVFQRPGGPPSLDAVASAEAGALEDFRTMADRTLDGREADQLLSEPAAIGRVLDYQLYRCCHRAVVARVPRRPGATAGSVAPGPPVRGLRRAGLPRTPLDGATMTTTARVEITMVRQEGPDG